MESYFLSVIIPTFKRNDNLKKAIESVLNQKGNFEVIVVDDNDSNSEFRKKNEQLMNEYEKIDNFSYIKHDKNKNGAVARNTGIKNAKGKYITFLDDDDEFLENRVESIEECLSKTNADFACSGYIYKYKGKIKKKSMPNLNCKNKDLQFELLCQKSFFGTGSNIICRKTIIDEISGFDESFIRHQDMEFMIRFLEKSNKNQIIKNYSVIKNVDDISNIPKFEKMVKIKEMYLNKFKTLINTYSNRKQKKIKISNYYELLGFAYLFNDKDEIINVKNFLKDNNCFSYFKTFYIHIKSKLKNNIMIIFFRRVLSKIM